MVLLPLGYCWATAQYLCDRGDLLVSTFLQMSQRSVWFEAACSQDMVGETPLLVVYAPEEVDSTPSTVNTTYDTI